MAGDWPLIGRTTELQRVRGLLAKGSGGVVLSGPAGVGKTRLATECLGFAPEYGFSTIRITATRAAASVPFGAFAALLPDIAAGTERTQVLRQMTRAVVGLEADRPVAILVDDAHLLDEPSAALTHQLATTENVFLFTTLRAGEPSSDAVMALWKDGLSERLDVKPFGPAEVHDFLACVLGAPPDAATARRFWDRTEGNVLFLRELVLAAMEEGTLVEEGGLFRLTGELPASQRLVELVEVRLRGLTEDGRHVVQVLALAEPLSVDLVARVAGDAALDDLQRRGVMRVEQDRYRLNARLGHPLYGEVIRARLSPMQTRSLSSALSQVLEGTGLRRREDVLRLATWRLAAGGVHEPSLLLAGARQAYARHDLVLAERLVQASWDAGAGFEAGLFLGIVVSNGGRPDEAEELFSALLPAAADDYQRSALAESRSQNFLLLRRFDLALHVAEEVEASLTDLAARAELSAHRALLLSFSGRRAEGVALAESLLPHAKGRALALSSLMVSGARANEGRLTEALRLLDLGMAVDVVLDAPFRWLPGIQRFSRVTALSVFGRLGEADAFGRAAYEAAVEESNRLAQGHIASGLAKSFTAQGRVTTGATWGRLGERLLREEGRPADRGYALTYLALALAVGGSHESASEALAQYDALPGTPDGDHAAEVLQARAWTSVAAGDIADGTRLLNDAVQAAIVSGNLPLESVLLHDLARLGRAGDVASRLAELAEVVEGPLTPVRAAHARALAAGDATELEAAMAGFRDAGALLLAAEAATDAAVAWRRAGSSRRAVAAERHAEALAAQCEGAVTPALATSAGVRATLTPRELEIARLAAEGVSNRDIAARLFLSVHTVENRLHIAYEKLGISRRSQLTDALRGP